MGALGNGKHYGTTVPSCALNSLSPFLEITTNFIAVKPFWGELQNLVWREI
jgi:hypothetical protein